MWIGLFVELILDPKYKILKEWAAVIDPLMRGTRAAPMFVADKMVIETKRVDGWIGPQADSPRAFPQLGLPPALWARLIGPLLSIPYWAVGDLHKKGDVYFSQFTPLSIRHLQLQSPHSAAAEADGSGSPAASPSPLRATARSAPHGARAALPRRHLLQEPLPALLLPGPAGEAREEAASHLQVPLLPRRRCRIPQELRPHPQAVPRGEPQGWT